MHDGRLHRHHTEPPLAIDDRKRTVALAVLCLCAFTTAVDITITNVALPFIGAQLDASTSELQWVIDAYTIVLAGLLVLGGGLADRFGRRRIFLLGYALFGLACLLAAFSPTVEALIGARIVMGIGAAGVIAPALAIVASRLSDSVGALSPANAAKAQGSIQGGLEVAQSLPNSAQAALASAARDAFDSGATAGYLVVAGLAFLATVWAWFALGRAPSETSVSVAEAAGATQ